MPAYPSVVASATGHGVGAVTQHRHSVPEKHGTLHLAQMAQVAATMQQAANHLPAPRRTQSRLRMFCVPAPPRTVRTTRRTAVVVQANLFARATRLLQSYANNVVSSQEDPEKLLDQVVNEMQEDLIKMRQAAAQVTAAQKQLEAKYQQAQTTADDWLRRAEMAVQKEEDELAKEALRRRKTYQDSADGLRSQLEPQQKAVDQLLANTRMLEGKLAEARSKKETLKARAASAKTSKQIQEMIGSLNTSNAVVAFEKMEEKVLAMEAEAETTALLVGGDKLDNKFAVLDAGSAGRLIGSHGGITSSNASASSISSFDIHNKGTSSNASTGIFNRSNNSSSSSSAAAAAAGSRRKTRKQQQQEDQEAVMSRMERARAKAQAVLVGSSPTDSCQPTSHLFADWSTGPPQHRPWRAAAAESYAEVIAAEFYALEVIDECMKSAAHQHKGGRAVFGVPAIIDVEAFKVAAAKAPRKSRVLKSASPGSSRTGAALVQAVQTAKAQLASGSSNAAGLPVASRRAAKGSKTALKASKKEAPVVARSRASLFHPARLLEPWLPSLGWMDPPKPAQEKPSVTEALAGVKKSTRGTRGTGIRKSKQGSTTRRRLKDSPALTPASEEPPDGGYLTPQMKAAQTRARNRAALYSDPEQLQQLLLEKWAAGQERVWLPAAEEAAIAAIGERIRRLTSDSGPLTAPPKGEQLMGLPALVDAVAQDSLRAQFGDAVLLPELPYYDMASLKSLMESRCKKARRLWARVCSTQPGRQFSKDEAAADQAIAQEWPFWSQWVDWFWDHPTYTPCPYRRSTLVIRTADTRLLESPETSSNIVHDSSGVAETVQAAAAAHLVSSSSEVNYEGLSMPSQAYEMSTVDTSQPAATSSDDPTLIAIREALDQFAEERRLAEAAFLAAMQQQHQQLTQMLEKHHAEQCELLQQQHTQQVQLRTSDTAAQKQFAKDQMDMVLQFQKKFASDQVEFLRLLTGLKR